MGLTGPALIAVLAAVAAVLLALLVWRWPKLAGRGAAVLAARAVALGVFELTVLALIFVLVNRSGGYFSSWSDLFGTDTGSAAITAIPAGATAVGGPRPAAGSAGASLAVTGSSAVRIPGRHGAPVPSGRLLTVRLHGQLSGLTAPGYLYLPPGAARARRASLPVTVVVSARAASRAAPYGAARLAITAALQIRAGRLRPQILVVLPAQIGSERACLNVPGGAQAATFMAQDLPQAVGSGYPAASPLSRRWALLGDASGGYCALQLALTSSATFTAAAVPDGRYAAPGGAVTGGSRQLRTQDDLAWVLRNRPPQPVAVMFTGHGAAPLMALMRSPMQAVARGLAPGAYPLGPVLDWLGGQLASATAARS